MDSAESAGVPVFAHSPAVAAQRWLQTSAGRADIGGPAIVVGVHRNGRVPEFLL